MNRRKFVRQTALTATAAGLLPNIGMGHQTQDGLYSIVELMGKEEIKLYGDGINLRKEAHDAFVAMKKAAYSDGIEIKVVSSFRNFERQEQIWDRKYLKFTQDDGMKPMQAIDKIIEYSTIPGTSRHHWGTDIDLIDGGARTEGDVLVPEKFEGDGPFTAFKEWMDKHANTYDFYLVYTNEPKRRGFKYEPWHYSYAPISKPMLTQFRSKNLLALLSEEKFLGTEHFTTGFLQSYIQDNIMGINPELL